MRSRIARQNPKLAFTLVEVMFAIFILGIGFIMLAAIFPVAIQQTKATVDETTSNSYAQDVANTIQQMASAVSQYMPATGTPALVYTGRDPRAGTTGASYNGDLLWTQLSGALIDPANSNYACVPLYLRGTNPTTGALNPYAQLFLITCTARATSTYNTLFTNGLSADLWRNGDSYNTPAAVPPALPSPVIAHFTCITTCLNLATLEPKPVSATFLNAASNNTNPVDQVTLSANTNAADASFTSPAFPNAYLAAAEGGYLIVSNSNGPTNGQIFKIGPPLPIVAANTLVFQLDPSTPLDTGGAQNFINASVFLVGRGLANPTLPWDPNTNPYTGAAQDVAVYTTSIRFE